ncbi:hypothetical protein BaRGS_00025623 [Batillaria attramentaria]|uniref:LAGLIDADG endonuclease n=1 Tax=Batillaria attramentaria TaxID=370345 RepID=A0ABD0K6S7_9CAEN
METFSQDSLHVLRRAGLGHLVQGHQGHRQYMKDEVRMLTEYVFRLYETRPGLRKCLRHSDLVDRLWRAFVLNGFINGKLTFHRKKISAEIDSLRTRQASDEAVDLLLRAQDERPVLSAPEMRAHRRRVMAQHYKGTPPDLLNKLVEIFERDFALFGYDPKPADIFGTSH